MSQKVKNRISRALDVVKRYGLNIDLPQPIQRELGIYEAMLRSSGKYEYSVPTDLEFVLSFEALSSHGIKFSLPQDLMRMVKEYQLFGGDDSLFKQLIPDAKNYFEYGSGKSTAFVYKLYSANVFSVDTSAEWVEKISGLIDHKREQKLHIKWIDVGEVGDWGYPKTRIKQQNFLTYAEWFWGLNIDPDLVLVDGRFRVLCFLVSVKNAKVGTKILFDDYTPRQQYHFVENFSNLIKVCGRQALFEVSVAGKQKLTDELIERYRFVIH